MNVNTANMNLDLNTNLNYSYNSNNNSPSEISRLHKYTNNTYNPYFSNPPSPDKMSNPYFPIQTFYLENYIVSLSFNTINNSIFMNVRNNIDDTTYEGNININELNSSFKYEDTYQMILNFMGKKYYSNITFNILLDIFHLKIIFTFDSIVEKSFILKVPIKNNTEIKNTELDTYIKKHDQEMGFIKQNMEKLYQSFNKSIPYLDKEIKNQKKVFDEQFDEQQKIFDVKLVEQQNDFNKQLSELKSKYDTEINELNNKLIYQNEDIDFLNDLVGSIDIRIIRFIPSKNIQSPIFYQINSLEVNISYPMDIEKIRYFIYLEKLTIQLTEDSIVFENSTVKHVIFNGGNIVSIKGIEKIPNVEILEFHYCSLLDDVKAHLIHTKVKKIVFIKCGDFQKRNMISYCKAKNIELSFN